MSEPTIVAIPPERLESVVEVLVESFFNYPTMRYILQGSGAQYPQRLRSIVQNLVDRRSAAGTPILGVDVGTVPTLAAAALIDPPVRRLPRTSSERSALGQEIGSLALERLESVEGTVRPLRPDFGFYNLLLVGVVSAYRGRGFSRLLVDRVVEMSVQDPDSQGVLLTTEHEDNVALYESMSFRVLGEVHTPDRRLFSWTMFRPDSARFDR